MRLNFTIWGEKCKLYFYCRLVIGKSFRVKSKKISQKLTAFCPKGLMLSQASRKVVGNTDVSLTSFSL